MDFHLILAEFGNMKGTTKLFMDQRIRAGSPRIPSRSPRATHPPAYHSKQTTLFSFFSSPTHGRRPLFPNTASQRHRNYYSRAYRPSSRVNLSQSERRRWERTLRAGVAKAVLERLPGILKQLRSKPPTGYLYTPPQPLCLDPKYCPNLKGKVRVVEGDTFDTAIQFDGLFSRPDSKDTRPVCVLNMANAYTAGGGFRNGALAQEEELCYRSSLFLTLKKRFYPHKAHDAIYSPNVVIIRKSNNENYRWLDVEKPESLPVVSAISIAAIENPKLLEDGDHVTYKDPADRELMKDKMRLILRVAAYNKHRRVVLSAFGCGAFHNPRGEVANCFAEVLKEKEFQGWWETIAFAIMAPPGNLQQRSSLELFKEVLDGLSI